MEGRITWYRKLLLNPRYHYFFYQRKQHRRAIKRRAGFERIYAIKGFALLSQGEDGDSFRRQGLEASEAEGSLEWNKLFGGRAFVGIDLERDRFM